LVVQNAASLVLQAGYHQYTFKQTFLMKSFAAGMLLLIHPRGADRTRDVGRVVVRLSAAAAEGAFCLGGS